MRRSLFRIGMVLFILGLQIGCDTRTTAVSVDEGRNLLQNSSFGEDGKPSGDYWRVANYPGFQFHNSAPDGGGKWSVCLPGDGSPGQELAVVYQTVPLPGGGGVRRVTLDLWARKSLFNRSVELQLIGADTVRHMAAVTIDSQNWARYIRAFSFMAEAGDSLRVGAIPRPL